MKKFRKGLLLAIASLSIGTMSGCDFFKKKTDNNENEQQQDSQTDDNVAVSSVTLDKKSLDLYVLGSTFLRATIAPENATNKYLTWSSSNDEIVTVSAIGKVTALAAGEADIKVESQADPTKSDSCHVTVSVKDDTVHVTSVTLDKQSADLYVGDTLDLTATVLPADATNREVLFASSNDNVAFVNSDGRVVARSNGDAEISATSKENPAIFAKCDVHVTTKDTTVHVTGLEVTPTTVELDLGDQSTIKPTVTVSPDNATNKAVNWLSSDPSKVVVDAQGNIVALAVTTEPVIVTVSSDEIPSIKQTISVTVIDTRDHSIHVSGVTLPEELQIDLKSASSALLSATVSPSNAGDKLVNWSSSNTEVIQIGDAVGETSVRLNALKTGTSTITATTHDGSFTDTCEVTVVDTKVYVNGVVIKQNNAAITDLDVELGSFEQVVANVLPTDADNQGIVWEMEEGAADYISFSSTSGSNLTIFGNAATPENTSFVVTAKSAENGAFKATLNVTVTDPTVYPDHVDIEVEGLVGAQSSANIEHTGTIKLNAKVYPNGENGVQNPEIEWVFPTNSDYIVATPNALDHSLTVLGKKITDSSSAVTITVKATIKNVTVSSDIIINVIDPTSMDRFVEFSNSKDYNAYIGHVAENNLQDPALVQSQETVSSKFYEYDVEDKYKYTYTVGDQGVFHFAPIANVRYAGQSSSTQITNLALARKLFLIEDETETEVTDSMSTYCSVDAATNDYTFTSEAVDKTFRLEFFPNDPNFYIPDDADSSDLTFKVVHGYNVDSLAELSLFDNVQNAWATYKNIYGLTSPAEGGIVLHKDIKITADVIPSSFLMSEDDFDALDTTDFNTWAHNYFCLDDEGATDTQKRAAAKDAYIGSFKDYQTVFKRSTKSENFTFEGNFFSVDFSELKPVYLMDPKSATPPLPKTLMNGMAGDGSHAQLFGINTSITDITEQHKVNMRNFSVKGNGGLETVKNTNILDALRKGGLIAFKLSNAKFNVENAIVSNSFVSFMTEGYTTNRNATTHATAPGQEIMEFNADRVTVYNAYSNMFYLFGSPVNHVSNSWMSKSGGPLILMDEPFGHAWYKDSPIAVSMDCTNCYLKNEVMGTEPWFEGHEGSNVLATEMIINPGLPGANWYYGAAYQSGVEGARTISRKVDETTKYCDLIAVDVYASNFTGNTKYNLRGSFTVNNGEGATAGLNMGLVARDPDNSYNIPLFPYANNVPYFFSNSATTLAYLTGTGLVNAGTTDLFTNKYNCGYLNPAYNQGNVDDPNNSEGRYIGVFLGTYPLA